MRKAAKRISRSARNGAGTKNCDLTLGRSGAFSASALLGDVLPDDTAERSNCKLRRLGARTLGPSSTHWRRSRSSLNRRISAWRTVGAVIYAALRFCRISAIRSQYASRASSRACRLAEPWGRGPAGIGTIAGTWRHHARLVQRQRRVRPILHARPSRVRRAGFPDVAVAAAWNAWEGGAEPLASAAGRPARRTHSNVSALFRRETHGLATRADWPNGPPIRSQELPKSREPLQRTIGVALLAADLDRPQAAAFPFLEDEGWR